MKERSQRERKFRLLSKEKDDTVELLKLHKSTETENYTKVEKDLETECNVVKLRFISKLIQSFKVKLWNSKI